MRIVCRVVADHDKNEAAMPRTMTILGSSSLWSRPARGEELVVTDLLRALVRQVQHDRSAAFGADSVYWNGAPGTIRTSDPQIRSLMLYPAELRARTA